MDPASKLQWLAMTIAGCSASGLAGYLFAQRPRRRVRSLFPILPDHRAHIFHTPEARISVWKPPFHLIAEDTVQARIFDVLRSAPPGTRVHFYTLALPVQQPLPNLQRTDLFTITLPKASDPATEEQWLHLLEPATLEPVLQFVFGTLDLDFPDLAMAKQGGLLSPSHFLAEHTDTTRFLALYGVIPQRALPPPLPLFEGLSCLTFELPAQGDIEQRLTAAIQGYLFAGLKLLESAAGATRNPNDAIKVQLQDLRTRAASEPFAAAAAFHLLSASNLADLDRLRTEYSAHAATTFGSTPWRSSFFRSIRNFLPGKPGRSSYSIYLPLKLALDRSNLADHHQPTPSDDTIITYFRLRANPRRIYAWGMPTPPIGVIVGPSGSGKSTLLALLASSFATRGIRCVYFDYGQTAKVPALNAGFATWDADHSGLDPFAVDDADFLRDWFLAQLPEALRTTQHRVLLRDAIARTLAGKEPSWKVFRSYLRDATLLEALELLPIIFRKPNSSPSSSLYIELEKAAAMLGPAYMPAAILLLCQLATPYLVANDRPVFKGAIVIDEAWLAFKTPAWVAVLAEWARTYRKKGVGLFLATQNPNDVPPEILGNLGCRFYGTDPAASAARYANHDVSWEELRHLPPHTWRLQQDGRVESIFVSLADYPNYELIPPPGLTVAEWLIAKQEAQS